MADVTDADGRLHRSLCRLSLLLRPQFRRALPPIQLLNLDPVETEHAFLSTNVKKNDAAILDIM